MDEKIQAAVERFRVDHKAIELDGGSATAVEVARTCGCPGCRLWLALEGEEPPPDIHPMRVIDKRAPQ